MTKHLPAREPAIEITVTYKVKHGDTLWGIAKARKVDLVDVLKHNPRIYNSDLIHPQDEIVVHKETLTPSGLNKP